MGLAKAGRVRVRVDLGNGEAWGRSLSLYIAATSYSALDVKSEEMKSGIFIGRS